MCSAVVLSVRYHLLECNCNSILVCYNLSALSFNSVVVDCEIYKLQIKCFFAAKCELC